MDDGTLLARYADLGDHEAFRTLVGRHLDLVYAAARRQLVDPGLAQDVTQAAFILLSQKARQLHGRSSLAGWLIQTTHYLCRDARKQAQRRRYHETRASMSHAPVVEEGDDAWNAISPYLDEAMLRLGSASRTAVALRYLENQPLKEVGAALGISEEAARKRVDRALEQLRKALSAKRVVAPAALGALLLAKAAEAAPPGMLAAATAAGTPAATALAAAGARILLWVQLKWALAAGLLILVSAAAVTLLRGSSPDAAGAGVAANSSPGTTIGAASAGMGGPVKGTIVYRGVLLDPERLPAPDAVIRTYLSRRGFDDRLEAQTKTSADGSFVVGPLPNIAEEEQTDRILLFDALGAALAWKWEQSLGFENPEALRVRLARPVSVAGTVSDLRGQPVAGAIVEASAAPKNGGYFHFNRDTGLSATTDTQGRYHFERIPQDVRLQLTVHHPDYQTWSTTFGKGDRIALFPVAAGTADADIQLEDRPATLRLQLTLDGKPVARAGVPMAAVERSQMRTEFAVTDKAGSAVFAGLSPGAWQLRNVNTPDGLRNLIVPLGDLTLQAGETRSISAEAGSIRVHIAAPEGEGGWVWLDTDAKRGVAAAMLRADEPLEMLLPPGAYRLSYSLWQGGTPKQIDQDFELPGNSAGISLTVPIHSPPRLHGQLVDAAGKPMAGFLELDGTTAVVGPDGRFSVKAPIGNSSPSFCFACDKTHSLVGLLSVSDTTQLDQDITLVLRAAGAITGRAVDLAGKPMADAGVDVGLQAPDGGGYQSLPENMMKTTIDSDGTFHMAPVPAGCRLVVSLRNRDQWYENQIPALRDGEARDLGQLILHGVIGSTRQTIDYQRNAQADPALTLPPREIWDATISGRLLDEAGKPVVGGGIGATLRSATGATVAFEAGVSDLKGRFSISGLPRERAVKLVAYVVNAEGRRTPYAWKVKAGDGQLELRLNAEAEGAATQPD